MITTNKSLKYSRIECHLVIYKNCFLFLLARNNLYMDFNNFLNSHFENEFSTFEYILRNKSI